MRFEARRRTFHRSTHRGRRGGSSATETDAGPATALREPSRLPTCTRAQLLSDKWRARALAREHTTNMHHAHLCGGQDVDELRLNGLLDSIKVGPRRRRALLRTIKQIANVGPCPIRAQRPNGLPGGGDSRTSSFWKLIAVSYTHLTLPTNREV